MNPKLMLIIITLLMAACQQPDKPIKIGLLVPDTDPNRTPGISASRGGALAVEQWNQNGGVLGRRITLVSTIGACQPDPAARAAHRLIERQGVQYLLGALCSPGAINVAATAAANRAVMLTLATDPAVTVTPSGRTRPTVFRFSPTASDQAVALARFALDQGYRTAFILYDPQDMDAAPLAQAFASAFPAAGGRIAGQATYRTGKEKFGFLLRQVNQSEAQLLFLPAPADVANRIGAQARARGLHLALLGSPAWEAPDLDLSALPGSFYPALYNPLDPSPLARDWLLAYDAAHHTHPDATATLAYDATNLLLAAIQQAGRDDPEHVAAVLAGLRWEGVTGPIAFDAKHNPDHRSYIIAIANGQKRLVETSLSP